MLSHNYLTSSIGKKQIMAVTGFGLIGFTASHLLGNLLLFLGPEEFNYYGHQLTSNPLIIVAELGLLGMFIAHIILGVLTRLQNMSARGVNYYSKNSTGTGETFASKTMPYTGLVLLVFVVLHLLNFKYGTNYVAVVEGESIRDLYRTVVEYFAHPGYVVWYVFAMCVLGFHTGHGFQSMFQTWGFNHPKYTPMVKGISFAYGILVAVGFSSLAIYCHFQN